MKKIKTQIILCLLALITTTPVFSGCENQVQNDNGDDSSNLQAVTVSEVTRDEDVLRNSVNACKNFTVADDMEIVIPETGGVYTFVTESTGQQEFQTQYTQFLELFQELYGDYMLNEDYLFYTGENSYVEFDDKGIKIKDYTTVQEAYDVLNQGNEHCDGLFYDETWYRDMTVWTSPVCLAIGKTLEYDSITFNKGKTVERNGKVDGAYPCLDYYSPYDSFACIGTYSPDSTESFPLVDKEVAVCEAVAFYENYINTLPYPEDPSVQVSVEEVDVLKVSENVYGYLFITSKEYCNVSFDYRRSGSYIDYRGCEKCDYSYAAGFMIESGDVDIGSVPYRTRITDETEIGIIPVESAIEIISNQLSDYVEFEVRGIELVYTTIPERTSEGYIDIETPSSAVAPSWKIICYNSNDRLSYFCYVDAADGGNFRYYTTRGDR